MSHRTIARLLRPIHRPNLVAIVLVPLLVAGGMVSGYVLAQALSTGSPVAEPAALAPVATVGSPVVSGPITGGAKGYPFGSVFTLPSSPTTTAGYLEREYFIQGTAQGYTKTGSWNSDGAWTVRTAGTAPFKTRLFVVRPADPATFNGTVVVEWLNVSSQVDVGADLAYAHEELLRKGYAYVGVSAQKTGVDALKRWDGTRYGSLNQPGDAYSYDIFSQAGNALRDPAGPLSGLTVTQVLADGESQSAMRMVTYVNAVHPVAQVFNGFLIHSRGASGAPIDDSLLSVLMPSPSYIRPGLDVPVFQVQSETDLVFPGLSTIAARQPDTAMLRTWEVPGTAHVDASVSEFATPILLRDAPSVVPAGCDKQVNAGQERYIMNAAVRKLSSWAAGGAPPPSAPVITTSGTTIQRDADGNALGGLRTPAIDVPFATYNGSGNGPVLGFCVLSGTTTYFSGPKIASRYPTHADYVGKVTAAANKAVTAGYLLAEDGQKIIADAQASTVGF